MTYLLRYNLLLFFVVAIASCREQLMDGPTKEKGVLEQMGLGSDTSHNATLREALTGINCLAATACPYKLKLAGEYNGDDSTHILVIPFSSSFSEYKSQAYSDIRNRFILVNPQQIAQFAGSSTLGDTTVTPGLISLTLLHETGHFLLGVNGAFDAVVDTSNTNNGSRTGELVMDTEPEYLTSVKRMEMKVDSIVVVMVKGSVMSKNMDCYGCASSVQLLVPGIAFQLFGTRIMGIDFGRPVKILRDPSASHPNMELRIAFMNYYLYPSDSAKQIIDDYLYDREVTPIHRQLTDPRIFQGDEKILPEDK